MENKIIKTSFHGIVIELGPEDTERPGSYLGGAIVESKLSEPPGDTEYDVAADIIERLMLAHAVAGLDVTLPAYLEGLDSVADYIINEYGDD